MHVCVCVFDWCSLDSPTCRVRSQIISSPMCLHSTFLNWAADHISRANLIWKRNNTNTEKQLLLQAYKIRYFVSPGRQIWKTLFPYEAASVFTLASL